MQGAGGIALVTGAGSGIGRATALALAEAGWTLVLAGRRPEPLDEVASLIRKQGGEALPLPSDVSDEESVDALFNEVQRLYGRLDLLFNNAGLFSPAVLLEDLTYGQWRQVVDVNLSGVFRVAQASARAMIEAGTGGSIINIASILGLRVRTQVPAYTATKAAVVQLTKALALEWASHGIRVNAIAPGYFETDLNREMLRSPMGRDLVGRIPSQRVGQLHELDGPLLLLASDASSYMTGTVIPVDGGHLVNTL